MSTRWGKRSSRFSDKPWSGAQRKELGKQQGAFLGTGKAQVEGLTGKRAEHLASTGRIRTLQPGHPKVVVPAADEFFHGFRDTLQGISTVSTGVLALVDGREALEVGMEDGLQDIWPPGDIAALGFGRCCDTSK